MIRGAARGAEWARMQEREQGRTAVESFNDRALENLIALARWYAIGGLIALVWGTPVLVWQLGWLGAALSAGHAALVALSGWWGWWHYGNKTWRPDA